MFAQWTSPEAAFQILKEISRSQPCDISGIHGYRMIDECGGIQWPFPESFNSRISGKEPSNLNGESARPEFRSERRLFEDGTFYHPDGKAKFFFEEPRPPAEPI